MKFYIKTYGCQMNALDSDKIGGILTELGYEPADGEGDADLILLNTCSVREGPESKVFSEMGRLRRHKRERGTLLGLVGCVAQQEGEEVFRRAPFVDLVMGPRAIRHLPQLLEQARAERALDTTFYGDSVLFPDRLIRRTHPVKAFITVMEGCDKRCTFCIVPATRGREVCRPLADIVEEARRAVDTGFLEVELLGQNVNCWREGSSRFADLLDAVSLLPGLRRLRFTTNHPRHFPLEVADLMAGRPVLCPYLHLPVQAGSDRILKLMRRQYDRAWYLGLVDSVRARVPELALSTDIIVGFPTETEAEFQDTLDIVRRVGYDQAFSFRYSPRPGTPAASMEGAVPEEVARERHQRLLLELAPIQAARYAAFLGREVEVLVEGESRRGGQFSGRARDNKVVNFRADRPVRVNTLVRVRVTHPSENSLQGELLGDPA